MIHFCNLKKQTQNDAYRRSQRQTAHQSKKKKQTNKKTSLYRTLFNTSLKKKNRMMLATPGLLHRHKGNAVKTSDVHSDETLNV